MGNPLTWIGEALGIIDKGMDIAKEAVTDKDKQNELIGNLASLKLRLELGEAYLAELKAKTIPWIDGLHKMSRTLLSFSCIFSTVLLLLLGYEITPTVALILGGPTAAYTIIKGKGKA